MNSTVGYGLVLVGLFCAAFAGIVGITTGMLRREGALKWVQVAIWGFAISMLASNLMMVKALLEHDFSVNYVAHVGSKSTPTVYTIVSLWSALEGSILFWGAILGAYAMAFAYIYRNEHGRYMQLTLGVLGVVAAFFAFLIAGPANPWVVVPNPPLDGPGPNALLQNHALMIIHPPMLYLGYVGMTVPFSIAAGALLRGEIGDAWLVPLRKWTLVPWLFLTIGIILGSWWAYAVLGWGGYWAWDPVENASLMPWLTATAFMHSTLVLERKKSLKLWTIALALASFVLTLVGTFMTRSGVFNSVHAFSQSDIGPTFLWFIGFVVVSSVILLAARGHLLQSETNLNVLLSREISIFMNNIIFTALTFTVLLGTLFPLVTEALQNKRISVGEPYFNKVGNPLGLIMLFLMGIGPMLPWGQSDPKIIRRQFIIPAAAALITAVLSFAFGFRNGLAVSVFAAAAFVTVVTLRELFLPAQQRMSEQKESFATALFVSASRTRRRFGGYIVHLGVVIVIVAVAASSAFKEQTSASIKVGEQLKVGNYAVRLDGFSNGKAPHKEWFATDISILSPDGTETKRHGLEAPRQNYYDSMNSPVGSPTVETLLFKDVYVSLVSADEKNKSATFNAWIFPMVGWIWYSIPVFVLGTLIAIWPQRKKQAASNPLPEHAAPAGSP